GGALAVIGGEQAFSASDFAGTAIEGVLPANLISLGPPPVDETPAQVKLTDAGKRHPVTELVPGAGANEQVWARLPKLPGLNTLGPVKDGAQTLLTAQDGRPVLVVGEVGRGRAELSSGEDGTPRAAAQATAGADGTARMVLPQLPAGAYKATVVAKRPDGTPVGEAEEAFVVQPSAAELLQPAPRPEILRAVA